MNESTFMERVVAALEDIATELSALNEHIQELGTELSDATDHVQELAGDAREANNLTRSWGRSLNGTLGAIAEALGAK